MESKAKAIKLRRLAVSLLVEIAHELLSESLHPRQLEGRLGVQGGLDMLLGAD